MQSIDVDAVVENFLSVLENIAKSLQTISLSLISTESVLKKIATQTECIVDALHNEDGLGITMTFQDHFDDLDKKEKEKEKEQEQEY